MSLSPWYLAISLYVGTYILLIPTWLLLRTHKKFILDSRLNQVVNAVFVEDYGYLLFTIAYLGCMVQYHPRIWGPDTKRLARNYGINTAFGLLINSWFFGASIVERINKATGGHCSIAESSSKSQCYADGGQWFNGFDVSGHYYLIVSMSLFCWQELLKRPRLPLSDHESDAASPNSNAAETGSKLVYIFLAILLTVWYIEFVITSLFFHTIMEKFWGLVLGMAVPVTLHATDVLYGEH